MTEVVETVPKLGAATNPILMPFYIASMSTNDTFVLDSDAVRPQSLAIKGIISTYGNITQTQTSANFTISGYTCTLSTASVTSLPVRGIIILG